MSPIPRRPDPDDLPGGLSRDVLDSIRDSVRDEIHESVRDEVLDDVRSGAIFGGGGLGHVPGLSIRPDLLNPDLLFPGFGRPGMIDPDFIRPDFIRPDLIRPDLIRPVKPTRDFNALLDRIPVVNDGDVITADHHNSLRAAIATLAAGMNEEGLERVITRSFAAALLPADQRVGIRIFAEGREAITAKGSWMPLDLPHGTVIDSMVVRGTGKPDAEGWRVALTRMQHTDFGEDDVIDDELTDKTAKQFGEDGFVATFTPGSPRAGDVNARFVDNNRFTYSFATGGAPAKAKIRLVQVTCRRG